VKKVKGTRSKLIPIGYVEADPTGNRASRRMAAKERKAAKRGRRTAHGTGGDPS
jgi:hypothetical protein